MKIYRIRSMYDMPIASGFFKTKELAQRAIDVDDWKHRTGYTKEEVIDLGRVVIQAIDVTDSYDEIELDRELLLR